MNPETQAQAAIGDIIGRLASGRMVLGADTEAAVGAAEICQTHQSIVLECSSNAVNHGRLIAKISLIPGGYRPAGRQAAGHQEQSNSWSRMRHSPWAVLVHHQRRKRPAA